MRLFATVLMAAILLPSMEAYSQVRNVEKVAGGLGSYYMNPSFSPDGRYLALSGSGYNSLHVMDLETGEIRQVSEAAMSGFGVRWSPDSQHLLFRHSRIVGNVREHAPAVAGVADTTEPVILGEYSHRMPVLPEWSADARQVITSDGRNEVMLESGIELVASKVVGTVPQRALLNRGATLVIVENGVERELGPVNGAEYLNARLSPEGNRVVFEVLGGSMYIVNVDGSGLTDLGDGNRPAWSPDGSRIVFMVAEDDGYDYTKSDLFLVNSDGSGRRALTTTTSLMEMNPSWSPDGQRIAFDVNGTGDIFILTIDPS